MTPDDLTPDTSLSAACVIVDALLDGEAVDKQALRDALDDRATRDYFVDALVLRQLTHEMAPMTFTVAESPVTRTRRPLQWVMSAAVLALVATGGYLAGHRREMPPPTADALVSAASEPGVTAPAPTKIIRLDPGVSWTTETARQ